MKVSTKSSLAVCFFCYCTQTPLANKKIQISADSSGAEELGDDENDSIDGPATGTTPPEETPATGEASGDEAATLETARLFLGYHYWWGGGAGW